jgi:hypothetical protein
LVAKGIKGYGLKYWFGLFLHIIFCGIQVGDTQRILNAASAP